MTNKRIDKNRLAKPFLKWAGGKRQLLTEIRRNIPRRFNTYYEPFLGAGAVLFDIQPSRAAINDTNEQLINCYRVIRDDIDSLIQELKKHKNNKDYYYEMREKDRDKNIFDRMSQVEKASRIIYLNKTCYNGLFRVNSSGQFNVPFGRYKNPNILDEPVLKAVSKYLNEASITILNTDFEDAVSEASKGDFVYFDPPYHPVSDTASFTGYDVNGFDKEEQKRLKRVFDDLTSRGCKCLLSNSYTDFVLDLYGEYCVEQVHATRSINSKASKRGRVGEVLVRNYEGD